MFTIQLLNPIAPAGLERLPAESYQLAADSPEPDAILVRSADMHGLAIPLSVKAIARAGAGINNVPVARLSERGIPVFNTPGANANAVKELIIAAMLMAARNLPEALRFVAGLGQGSDIEQRVESGKKQFVGSELQGKTLGVMGLGAIGVKVANAAHALGMRVIGLDPHMTVEGAWRLSSEVARAATAHELFAGADFVTFHVPLNEATRRLFDAEALATVKKGVVLLNFSRAEVIDTAVVAAGLESGRISRYITDFPQPAWLNHPRVMALPHLGASTWEAEKNCAVMAVDQLREFLEHGNVSNAINFPDTRMARAGVVRLCIANRNRPNMIGQLSKVLGEAGVNIAQMHNASRGDLAYTLLDIDSTPDAAALNALQHIEGLLSVRVV